jgi:flagellar biosynthesis/type III secretory pathway M-ring protein FliF/YscJ
MSQLDHQGYERKDATFKPLFLSSLGVFAFLAVGMIISYLFYSSLENRRIANEKEASFVVDERWQGPSLQLETHPTLDYKAFKKEEDKKVASYSWVDPSKEKIRIPVEEAMKNALKKGFKTRELRTDEVIEYDIPLESGGLKKGKG